MLPRGWKQRLVPIRNENTRGVTGLCLELHDLLIAQYVAGRDKDRRFTAVAALAGLAQHETLLRRLEETELDGSTRARVQAVIERDFDGQPS
ncbi:MAG: hypothetical protein HYY25_13230 [Candidatus Wallbacteria bacterium]|nr:hypothetical protein [Candidatus Wallbacteria bacterium]